MESSPECTGQIKNSETKFYQHIISHVAIQYQDTVRMTMKSRETIHTSSSRDIPSFPSTTSRLSQSWRCR